MDRRDNRRYTFGYAVDVFQSRNGRLERLEGCQFDQSVESVEFSNGVFELGKERGHFFKLVDFE